MRVAFRGVICLLAASFAVVSATGEAASAALFGARVIPPHRQQVARDVGYWRYYDGDDDSDYAPPIEYVPPPPVYRAPPPPAVHYEPPVYGWVAPPPRPANCGEYRYWNGEFCADARYRPPYVGPRW